jgi:hypothetical protein
MARVYVNISVGHHLGYNHRRLRAYRSDATILVTKDRIFGALAHMTDAALQTTKVRSNIVNVMIEKTLVVRG